MTFSIQNDARASRVRFPWHIEEPRASMQQGLFQADCQPVERYHSGSSAYWDFRGYMLAGVGIGVTATELPKGDDGRMIRMIAAYTRNNGRAFVDSGAFGAFVAGRPLDFTSAVFPVFDDILAAGADACRLRFVMPDVVGNATESMHLQRMHAPRIRSWIEAGAGCIFPLHSPGDIQFLRAIHAVADGRPFTVGVPSNLEAWSFPDLMRFCERHKPAAIHLLGLGQDRKVQAIAQAIASVSPQTGISCDSCTLIAHVGSGRRLTDRCRTRLADAVEWVMTDSSAEVPFPTLSTYVAEALHKPGYLDDRSVAEIALRFDVDRDIAVQAARIDGLLAVLGPLDPDEEWLEWELVEFIRTRIYGPELERLLRGPIRAWEVSRLPIR